MYKIDNSVQDPQKEHDRQKVQFGHGLLWSIWSLGYNGQGRHNGLLVQLVHKGYWGLSMPDM